eukprot:jgi/Chrpa1/547/Chrysochromulina_OHIO_Genome00010528-RA
MENGRATVLCISSIILVIGTAVYYVDDYEAGPLVGAVALAIGFSGLFGADISEISDYEAAGKSVLVPSLSAFGTMSLVLGSIGAIPAVNEMDYPFDRLGVVCWKIGAVALAISAICKTYQILKSSEAGLKELPAFLMESFFFVGASLFWYGCVLYDAGGHTEQEIEEELKVHPMNINDIWMFGCIMFTIGPTYQLLCGYSIENLAYTFAGWIFILGTTAYYFTWWVPEAYVGATCYLIGCAVYVFFDSRYFLSLPAEDTWLRINQGFSVFGDLLYFFGSIGFQPGLADMGYPYDRIGIDGFIYGSIAIAFAQGWKMLRLLRDTQVPESHRFALVSAVLVGIGACLFYWAVYKFGSWEIVKRSDEMNYLLTLGCSFFAAAHLYTIMLSGKHSAMLI